MKTSKFGIMLAVALLTLSLAAFSMVGLGGNTATETTTHTYFIAADEVEWDYAPSGINQITGLPFGDAENVFVQQTMNRIGKVYIKALYREYTDATFTKLKPIPAKWKHLGLLGPAIQAEVGDTIKIVFKNNASFNFSLHPHGAFYNKDSEGAPYNDSTFGSDKADDSVQPGATVTLTWQVPERAGPGPNDGSSIMWIYHSHVDESGDTNAGLVGPMIIYKDNSTTTNPKEPNDIQPKDVDKEFVTLFTVMDENRAPYIDQNIQTFINLQHNHTMPRELLKADDGFIESNLMHSINGYVFGNLPLDSLTMRQGERVRWYVFGMGTEVDLHTPHWHGNTGLFNGMRTDVLDILPASMKVLDMVPDNPGIWLYHCHVNDHIDAGMLARYNVLT
ncbi:multicopper oxidase domain-containing protein [Candidatus Methanoperedens nitratireducens]|uniref:Hephaestin n=1 Tax=Candidatus Methanoperedens nitratireducens TaxID=1392998 RepID=A0A284VKK7_9EURY|nr:multicopper oxidase domain-containing protein [Candidatus Methanoperedens nitroreducens]SNQ59826.1 Hephaestin [Candidatus Methanoperedens nitroreducens]